MNSNELNSDFFSEEQRFTQWGLWLFFVLVIGDLAYTYINGGDGKTDGIIGAVITCLVFLSFLFFKLKTRINQQGIYVQFVPFHRQERFYPWEQIQEISIRSYHPIREYGGWGLRGLGSNRALNVKGKVGIQLVLTNGDRLLIGTQEEEQARKAIDSFFTK